MARTAFDNFNIQKMVCIDVEKEMLEKAERFCDDGKVEFLQCDVRVHRAFEGLWFSHGGDFVGILYADGILARK